MRVLIVTNMWPTPARPAFGSFVRDQVTAIRALAEPGLEVEVEVLPAGSYAGAARALRAATRQTAFDVVHAHYGLTLWPALVVPTRFRAVTLHGTDVRDRRAGLLTRAALPFADLVASVSADLARELPPARGRQRRAVLPCGVAVDRFFPQPRDAARRRNGLDPAGTYLLFPADPARAGKRADRARELAAATGATLLTAGNVDPAEMPWLVNAANAVVVPSDAEGFGLAALEALACDIPVLATPTGNHPETLANIGGALCAPFDLSAWAAALAPHLTGSDSRIAGRERALQYGAAPLGRNVVRAWRQLAGEPLDSPGAAS